MILGGRLCKQSAIALVSDTIIHHKNTKRLCSLAQLRRASPTPIRKSRLGTGVSGSFRSRLEGSGSTT